MVAVSAPDVHSERADDPLQVLTRLGPLFLAGADGGDHHVVLRRRHLGSLWVKVAGFRVKGLGFRV